MKVRFTPEADGDLRDIADWIARDAPYAALQFVTGLRSRALGIGAMPLAFPIVAQLNGLPLRKRTYRAYAILYRVTADVEIVRFVHARRNYLSLLQTP